MSTNVKNKSEKTWSGQNNEWPTNENDHEQHENENTANKLEMTKTCKYLNTKK